MRQTVYQEMCAAGIFMTSALKSKIRNESEEHLEARWLGIKLLAGQRRDLTNRAGWMATMMWWDTALEAGKPILKQQRLQASREQYSKNQKQQDQRLAVLKWSTWQKTSNRDKLVEDFLHTQNDFFQEYFRCNFMPPKMALDELPKEVVLNWLWNALPV